MGSVVEVTATATQMGAFWSVSVQTVISWNPTVESHSQYMGFPKAQCRTSTGTAIGTAATLTLASVVSNTPTLTTHQYTGTASVTSKPFDVDVSAQFMTIVHKSVTVP